MTPPESAKVRYGREALQQSRMLLKEHELGDDMATLTRRMTENEGGMHSVVVVGEVSTGKSTLVNALLGVTDLSPVGDGETTGTYLNFSPPTDALPVGRARVDFIEGTPIEIEDSHLRDWVCVGTSALLSPDGDPPLGVVVSVENPSTPGVVLVDTPGTGGLNPAHARLAIKHSERASVLLLVTDAGGRITRPALDFLASCAEHVEAIVVAVNQIDLSSDWQEIVDENRAILLAESPRYAEVAVVGVSAFRTIQALSSEDPERAARRRESSRIDELIAALQNRLAVADRLPAVHALRQTQALLGHVSAGILKDVQAIDSDAQALAELEKQSAHLQELKADRKTWRQYLNRDLKRLRSGITDEVRDKLIAYEKRWADSIRSHRFGIGKDEHRRMTLDMHAEATVIIDDLTLLMDKRILGVITGLFAESGLGDFSNEIMESKDLVRRASSDRISTTAADSAIPVDMSLMMGGYSGFHMGGALGSLAGLPAAGAIGTLGLVGTIGSLLGPALGAGGLIALNLLMRGSQQRKGDVLMHLRETVATLRTEIINQFDSYLTEFTPEVEIVYERELNRAITDLDKRVATATAAHRGSEEARREKLTMLNHTIERVNEQVVTNERAIADLLIA